MQHNVIPTAALQQTFVHNKTDFKSCVCPVQPFWLKTKGCNELRSQQWWRLCWSDQQRFQIIRHRFQSDQQVTKIVTISPLSLSKTQEPAGTKTTSWKQTVQGCRRASTRCSQAFPATRGQEWSTIWCRRWMMAAISSICITQSLRILFAPPSHIHRSPYNHFFFNKKRNANRTRIVP